MARRPTIPLLVAFACLLAMGLTGVLALASAAVHERDAAMLHGFVALDRPRVDGAVHVLPLFVVVIHDTEEREISALSTPVPVPDEDTTMQ